MIESKFLTKSKFSVLIENAVIKQKMSYMDAVLDVCDKNAIDPEDVKKFISTPIRDKIEAEAMRLNYLPKGNTLLFEQESTMTQTRDERMAKSEAARVKRRGLKQTLLSKTNRFYTRMRKLRRKKSKLNA